jgi:hypothetical protein
MIIDAFPVFLLLLVLIGVSLGAGFVIARKAEEELQPGRRHFLLAQRILLLLTAGLVAMTMIPVYVFLALSLLILNKEVYAYMILGGSLAATIQSVFFAYQAAIIILYMIISAALLTQHWIEEHTTMRRTLRSCALLFGLFVFSAVLGYAL